MGEKVINFETNDIKVKYSLDLGFNYIKFPYAYGEENFYFMQDQKYLLFRNKKFQQRKKR